MSSFDEKATPSPEIDSSHSMDTEDRAQPSGWLYRASKAALNSVLKDAALVLRERATCVALHPGWVRTDMGGPSASLSVEESVAAQRRVLAGLAPAQNGGFLDPQGNVIPW